MCPFFLFYSVPSPLISSVTLTRSSPTRKVGSSVTLFCTALLTVNISGAMIEFDYGFRSKSAFAASGTTQTNTTTISPVSISSAGEYTCTVTVTAPGVCESGPRQVCPTKISDPVSLTVLCECVCPCL